MLPSSAREHYQRLQQLQQLTLLATRRAWARMDTVGSWEAQWAEDVGPKITALVTGAQIAATQQANTYVTDVLAELSVGSATAQVAPAAFAGYAGDGRSVAGLLAGSVSQAGRRFTRARVAATEAAASLADVGLPTKEFDPAMAAHEALDEASRWIDMVAATILTDTARAATSALMTGTPEVQGWVRVLNPPSCSRCVVLAGKFFRWNDGFDRHPRCDCFHVPAREAIAGDLTVNPDAYFRSLTSAEQDRTFTAAGAQAVRDGADLGQVVNARRGMYRAQAGPARRQADDVVRRGGGLTRQNVFGRDVATTNEGTTRRGVAYQRLNERFQNPNARTAGERYFRTTGTRLMPESIYEVASDRADAVRLLKLHGYLL